MCPLGKRYMVTANDDKTRGVPLMLKRLTLAPTSGIQTIELQVPKNERWMLYAGSLINCALGSGTADFRIRIYDEDDGLLYYLLYVDAAAGVHGHYPNNVASTAYMSGGSPGNPLVLFEGQKIHLQFAAHATKSGSYYYYLTVLQYRDEAVR